jgi:phospholipase/carboxylesterase
MTPLSVSPRPDLAGKPVLILSGAMDPIVPAENVARLAAILKQAGAAVQHRILPGGHALTQADMASAKTWLAGLRGAADQPRRVTAPG